MNEFKKVQPSHEVEQPDLPWPQRPYRRKDAPVFSLEGWVLPTAEQPAKLSMHARRRRLTIEVVVSTILVCTLIPLGSALLGPSWEWLPGLGLILLGLVGFAGLPAYRLYRLRPTEHEYQVCLARRAARKQSKGMS